MAGKGSKARPLSVDKKQFDSNWDRIFKKPKENSKGGHAGVSDSKSGSPKTL